MRFLSFILGFFPAMAMANASVQSSACPVEALFCVSVIESVEQEQQGYPITFGHGIAKGLLLPRDSVVASVGGAVNFPVQLDGVATHEDGTVRFAVFSFVASNRKLRAGDHIAILRAPAGGNRENLPRAFPQVEPSLRLNLVEHTPQIIQIRFGPESDSAEDKWFSEGETLFLRLGSAVGSQLELQITKDMAGPGRGKVALVAQALEKQLAKNANFRGYRHGEAPGGNLWIVPRNMTIGAYDVTATYMGKAEIAIGVVQAYAPSRSFSVSSWPTINVPQEDYSVRWLDGDVVREIWRIANLHDDASGARHSDIQVKFAVRQYSGVKSSRVSLLVENANATSQNAKDRYFDLYFSIDGESRLVERAAVQYRHSRWHRSWWTGSRGDTFLAYDGAMLRRSRLVPNYMDISVSPKTLDQFGRQLADIDVSLMSPGTITQYMPMTGGRADLGILPVWAAAHLLSQDLRALKLTLANGDAAGTAPVHYIDWRSGLPYRIDQNEKAVAPRWWFVGHGSFPPLRGGPNPWTIDVAHQPSLSFYPYLLTGDLFHLEELHYWTNWNALSQPPNKRDGRSGLLYHEQVRGQAWALRTLIQAALITPDSHQLKRYFLGQLEANLNWYADEYAENRRKLPGPHRWIDPLNNGMTAPWQHDFFATVVGMAANNGYSRAKELLHWMAGFGVDRWLRTNEGYCLAHAPSNWIKVKPGRDLPAPEGWDRLHQLNWPNVPKCPDQFPRSIYPDAGGGYVAVGIAALASYADAGVTRALEALNVAAPMARAAQIDYSSNPVWAIRPYGVH